MTASELTSEGRRDLSFQLSSARRAVGNARLAGDPSAEAEAHARVHSVKLALGAGGESWWEDAA